jgi:hypothetical protein
MMMTDDVEQQLRTRLHARADGVTSTPPPSTTIVRAARARERRRRSVVGGVAVAALAGAGALAFVPRDRAVPIGMGAETPQPPGSTAPAVPAPRVPAGPGEVTRILVPGWSVERYLAHPPDPGNPHMVNGDVEYQFQNAGRRLQVHFYEAADFDTRTGGRAPTATVRGTQAVVSEYDGTRWRLDWIEDGRIWEIDAKPIELNDLLAVVETIDHPDEATWQAALPAGTVVPSARPAVVDELLAGVALPPGFDVTPLRVSDRPADRYNLSAEVYGRVMCGWAEQWLQGPGPARTAAVSAFRSAPDWPGLTAMDAQGAWGKVLKSMAQRVIGGDVEAARHMPDAMGCPGAKGW